MNIKEILQLEIKQINKAPLTNIVENVYIGVDKTFTVGFDNGTKYNEISYAEELSRQIPVKNISKIIAIKHSRIIFLKSH